MQKEEVKVTSGRSKWKFARKVSGSGSCRS